MVDYGSISSVCSVAAAAAAAASAQHTEKEPSKATAPLPMANAKQYSVGEYQPTLTSAIDDGTNFALSFHTLPMRTQWSSGGRWWPPFADTTSIEIKANLTGE